jgi:hypothetical protein
MAEKWGLSVFGVSESDILCKQFLAEAVGWRCGKRARHPQH